MNKDKIFNYYKDKIDANAPDYKILGWESQEAQESRFKILLDHLSSNDSLLDVGCGVGSLYAYLQSALPFPIRYTGVDLLPEMVSLAQQRHPSGQFINVDLFKNNPFPFKSFDCIYASGIFNIQLQNNEAFLLQALALFQKLAKKKIVFNLLSDQSPNQESAYFYSNPSQIPNWLAKAMNPIPNFSITEGYLNNDYTVILELE